MSSPSYDGVAKTLHWLIALLVLALIVLGVVMTQVKIPIGTKFQIYQIHKSLGFTVLALMVLRVLWRLTHRPPPLPENMGRLERFGAHAAHLALYGLLISMPLSGWAMVSSASFQVPTKLYWTLPVPHIEALSKLEPAARKPYEELFKMVHERLAWVIAALVLIHALAALRHHFIKQDDVLARMWPRGRRRGSGAAVLAIAGLAAAVSPMMLSQAEAQAPQWKVDLAKSSLKFSADSAGQQINAKFDRFQPSIAFDPAKPETASVTITIDMTSANTGQKEADEVLVDEIWFDTKKYPSAVFKAAKAEKAADGGFTLIGELTMKGQTKPVLVPFKLSLEGAKAKAIGALTINRLTFGVGPAGAIAGMTIGNDVRVTLTLEAEPAG